MTKEQPSRERRENAKQIKGSLTFPASEFGVTLTVSEEALRDIQRIELQHVRPTQEKQKFSKR